MIFIILMFQRLRRDPTEPLLTPDDTARISELSPPVNHLPPSSESRDMRLIRGNLSGGATPVDVDTLRCISNYNVNLNGNKNLLPFISETLWIGTTWACVIWLFFWYILLEQNCMDLSHSIESRNNSIYIYRWGWILWEDRELLELREC